jgi:hypothetical protein
VVAPLFAFLAERPAHQALVIHDHNFLGRHRCLIYYEMEAACFGERMCPFQVLIPQ